MAASDTAATEQLETEPKKEDAVTESFLEGLAELKSKDSVWGRYVGVTGIEARCRPHQY